VHAPRGGRTVDLGDVAVPGPAPAPAQAPPAPEPPQVNVTFLPAATDGTLFLRAAETSTWRPAEARELVREGGGHAVAFVAPDGSGGFVPFEAAEGARIHVPATNRSGATRVHVRGAAAGLEVRAAVDRNEGPWFRATTDAQGVATFPPFPDIPGLSIVYAGFRTPIGRTEVVIGPCGPRTLAFDVRTPDGAPVFRALVSCHYIAPRSPRIGRWHHRFGSGDAWTDRTGKATLTVEAGDRWVQAQHPWWGSMALRIRVDADTQEPIEFRFPE
jgi:hypothetical protein